VVLDNGRVTLMDLPRPKLSGGDVLVKMRACGLCGTDIEKIKGQYTASQPVLGHEPAGVIVESAAENAKEGERVFVHHHVPCYSCYYCKRDSPTMCPYYRKTNLDPGGFSEYFRVPAFNVERGGILKLPAHVSFEEGGLVEPLATVIRAQRRAKISKGDQVLVVGVGPMGVLHVMYSKTLGASSVIATDVSEYRLELSAKLGADHVVKADSEIQEEVKGLTEGRGADVVIVASGSPRAIINALKAVRRGGTVLLFGVPFRGTKLDYDVSDLVNNEVNLISSNAAVEEDTRMALSLISEGRIDVKRIITHRFSLDQFPQALKEAEEGRAMKVMILD